MRRRGDCESIAERARSRGAQGLARVDDARLETKRKPEIWVSVDPVGATISWQSWGWALRLPSGYPIPLTGLMDLSPYRPSGGRHRNCKSARVHHRSDRLAIRPRHGPDCRRLWCLAAYPRGPGSRSRAELEGCAVRAVRGHTLPFQACCRRADGKAGLLFPQAHRVQSPAQVSPFGQIGPLLLAHRGRTPAETGARSKDRLRGCGP